MSIVLDLEGIRGVLPIMAYTYVEIALERDTFSGLRYKKRVWISEVSRYMKG